MFKIFRVVKQLRSDVDFLLSQKIKEIIEQQEAEDLRIFMESQAGAEEVKTSPITGNPVRKYTKNTQKISPITGKPVRKYTKKK